MARIPYLLEDTLDDLSVVFGTKPVSRSLDSLLRNIKKTDQLTDQSADQFFKDHFTILSNTVTGLEAGRDFLQYTIGVLQKY